MSNDFKKVLVKDDRLMVTDSLNYAVIKGGQNVISQTQNAISQSNSSISFNLQVPSEQTIVDRKVFVSATVTLRWQTTNSPTLVYGQNLALAPFPLHQMCSTVTATINNSSTTINIRDVLPFLVRSNDCRELAKSMSSCPTRPDSMFYYSDAVGNAGMRCAGVATAPGTVPQVLQYGPAGNTLGSFITGSIDTDILPNGAYSGPNARNSAPGVGVESPATLYYSLDNGQTYTAQGTQGGANASSNFWQLVFTTTEPVLCQPFLWSDPVSNRQGMYGVQTIQLQYNIANADRVVRHIETQYATNSFTLQSIVVASSAQITAVNNAKLILKYLTPHPSDLLPARNVIPYLSYDRYFANASNQVIPQNYGPVVTIASNTYNLTQIPDKICIFFRKKMTNQRPTDSDAVPVIRNISINFNNNAGLLSSATLQDLYYYSVQAGSNQSFNEFCGQAYIPNLVIGGTDVEPTVGSYLMLDFATIIQLTEDFYAPGSLGNFQLQFTCGLQGGGVGDPAGNAFEANSLETVLVVMNSGIMVTERGQTSIYTGILTKQDVLDASQQTPFGRMSVKRMVGSGMCDSGRALPSSIGHALMGKTAPVVSKVVDVAKDAMSRRLM
jgi:hypothetical protein